MQKNRRFIKRLLENVQGLKRHHEYIKDDLVDFSSESMHAEITEFYNGIIKKLQEKLKSLPIGYRYTGEFYLKKQFVIPTEFEKHSGSLFMREDLVSWRIETADNLSYQSYCRKAFKSPSEKDVITKEEALAIYASDPA